MTPKTLFTCDIFPVVLVCRKRSQQRQDQRGQIVRPSVWPSAGRRCRPCTSPCRHPCSRRTSSRGRAGPWSPPSRATPTSGLRHSNKHLPLKQHKKMNNFVKTIVSTLKPRIHDSLSMEHPQPGAPWASSAPWESRMPEVQVDHLEWLLPTQLRRQLYQAEHI